jgi:hypothetical protein
VALIVLTTLALAAYGAAGSYVSVRDLAAAHQVPLPALVPAGIDGGLLGTVALDIVLTWIGYPLTWMRAVARMFVAGTIAANVLAGWPDPVSAGLHAAAPLLILMFVEAARSVLLRAGSDAMRREPIPAARWVMAPWPTFVLWRRMVLWRINSYADAVDMELSRRQAIIRLTARYGLDWTSAAPDDLVWMLRNGVRLAEACARAAEITAEPDANAAGETGSPDHSRNRTGKPAGRRSGNRAGASGGNRQGTRSGNHPAAPTGTAAGTPPPSRVPRSGDLLGAARRIAADHRAASGREITVAELALAMGRRKKIAGDLLREIRAGRSASAPGSTPAAEGEPGEEMSQ